jgi:hypothetical protein
MRNWNQTQERYLKLDSCRQLGEIASSLSRIKSQVHLEVPQEGVSATIEECHNFVTWTIPNVNVAAQEHLIALEQLLSSWQRDLSMICSNSLDRAKLAEQSKIWSDVILNDSGLLTQKDLPTSAA